MYKIIVGVRRHPGITVEEFRKALREHGERVKQHPHTQKYLKRYVQNYTSADQYKNAEPPFDAIVEEWFDSAEAHQEFISHPDYLGPLRSKISEFTDATRRTRIYVEEVVVL
jgi:hypothetical protein